MTNCFMTPRIAFILVPLFRGVIQAASFQNLDFELATLPVIPRGQVGFQVPASQGLPGWSIFVGSTELTWVLHNNASAGPPAVSIWGPDWPYGPYGRIEGNFTAVLNAGSASTGPPLSISQTAIVPADAQWLIFKARPYPSSDVFAVSLSGFDVPMVVLASDPNYQVFGGNIGQYAGREAELRFSVSRGLGNGIVLDSIGFSVVPEASGLMIFAGGVGVAWSWRRWQARWRVA